MLQASSILVVDDSISARHCVRKAVAAVYPEARISEAKNADEAEKVFDDAKPELGILDMNMPGRSGLELAEALLKRGIAIHLVLCTAGIQKRVENRAAILGIPIVDKPVSIEKLRAVLDR